MPGRSARCGRRLRRPLAAAVSESVVCTGVGLRYRKNTYRLDIDRPALRFWIDLVGRERLYSTMVHDESPTYCGLELTFDVNGEDSEEQEAEEHRSVGPSERRTRRWSRDGSCPVHPTGECESGGFAVCTTSGRGGIVPATPCRLLLL